MKNFFALEKLYSDLTDDKNFRRLIDDVITSVVLHPYPWDIKLSKEKIFESVKERNLINVFFAIYQQYLESTHKIRWGCKSTFMINHVALIRRYYPRAKYLYMVRDGRDVAVSAKDSIFNHFHVYYTARLWKDEQQMGISWLNQLSKDEIFLIKYEELLKDFKGVIQSICSFLNEPFQDAMLCYQESDEARKSSSISTAWRNTAKPLIKDNAGRFKDKLNFKEIDLFERIAASELNYFSYELSNPFHSLESERRKGVKFRIRYLIEEILLLVKVQIKHFFTDKNNFLRYRKFWFIKGIRILRTLQ